MTVSDPFEVIRDAARAHGLKIKETGEDDYFFSSPLRPDSDPSVHVTRKNGKTLVADMSDPTDRRLVEETLQALGIPDVFKSADHDCGYPTYRTWNGSQRSRPATVKRVRTRREPRKSRSRPVSTDWRSSHRMCRRARARSTPTSSVGYASSCMWSRRPISYGPRAPRVARRERSVWSTLR